MSATEEYLRHAAGYAQGFTAGDLPLPPGRATAVVACMDARLDVYGLLGLSPGDSHVIRNAGGVVTEDVLRSLAISQRLLGTREVLLVHHTGCGMLTFTDEEFQQVLADATGQRPAWAPRAFPDLEQDVRDGLAAVRADPFLVAVDAVRGFVYDVRTGGISEVDAA